MIDVIPSSRRRAITALAAFSTVDFALGALVQARVVRRLPDLPIPGIDSHRVMTSRAAYPFGIPDTALAIAQNALVIALAGSPRTTLARRRLLVGVTLGGLVGVIRYAAEMIRMRRACAYCLAAAAAMTAMVPLALRDARAR